MPQLDLSALERGGRLLSISTRIGMRTYLSARNLTKYSGDYGPEKALDASYIASVVATHRLAVLYPVLCSSGETGQRRGCAMLANEADWLGPLVATGHLRRA
jgi:hypothetical protein